MSPRRRWLNATSSTRSAARAAATISVASSTVRAIGFSHRTWSPRSNAASAIRACRNVGTAMLTTSSPSVSSRSSHRATSRSTPWRAASSVRSASSSPAMTASSTPGIAS